MQPQQMLLWALRLPLGALLIWAAWSKLWEPAPFVDDIANYQIFPALAPLMATTLPGIELVVGLALCVAPATSEWLRAAASITLLLMVMFTLAVVSVLLRGLNIECGCFGGGAGPVTMWTLARDVGLVALSAGVIVVQHALRTQGTRGALENGSAP